MNNLKNNILLLKGSEIDQLLLNRENEILETIKQTYQAHANGNTVMPPNAYLRFPNMEKERIIAKPAYLGENFNTAGIKWIASFPKNLACGIERASATLILNSAENGHPTAIMESSIISAKRTASSAALAANYIYPNEKVTHIGLVGCGLINFETLRFLISVYPMIETVHLVDLSEERAEIFKNKSLNLNSNLNIYIHKDYNKIIPHAQIIAFGTTAVQPFVNSVEDHLPHSLILHTSLRDLKSNVIINADNIVDDIDQVCSNQTSVHLAEQEIGSRKFIRTTIGDILNENAKPYDKNKNLHIFSPFGLGILDMGLAHLVEQLALKNNIGTIIEDFLPDSWTERN